MWLDEHPAIGYGQVNQSIGFQHPTDLAQMGHLIGAVADMFDDMIGQDDVETFRLERKQRRRNQRKTITFYNLTGVRNVHGIDVKSR